jgi:hypothetical protein
VPFSSAPFSSIVQDSFIWFATRDKSKEQFFSFSSLAPQLPLPARNDQPLIKKNLNNSYHSVLRDRFEGTSSRSTWGEISQGGVLQSSHQ